MPWQVAASFHRWLLRGSMHPLFPALLAALLPAAALAQSGPRPDPLDANAAVAPLVHRSALRHYKPLGADAPALSWREANDAVERIGGWRAYAREAQAAPAAASAAAPTPAPAASAPAPRATRPATPAPAHRH
jgi:hypothetical protein